MSKLRQLLFNIVLIGASLVFTWAVAEGFLRAVLFVEELPSFGLREPWRYAADLDDDYWKLAYIFEGERKGETVGFFNPELGWDTQPTTDQPLGIRTAESFADRNLVEPILFYGDSFVGGKHNIPEKLDALLLDRPVLNLGVGGYGVDQIFLKFSKTVQYFENPLVLI
ncbi:MAG: hypothetical protein KJP16_13005, partial [Gammaproteobacteria bacterium]|nr:hypothetical protein [Gammaproteobacteria bacterium]NNL51725.1 hypothetical protein [Woeseiaceae bacterium]